MAQPPAAVAQSYSFNSVVIEGNNRVDAATILSYAGISRGQAVSAAELNDAYQRIAGAGLFETVEIVPQGGRLLIKVTEYPVIGRINIEGNRRLDDDEIKALIRSQELRIYSPATAEADAAAITQAYQDRSRLAATITPKIIRRGDNSVDLVFEVAEGKVVEIERLSFVGNRKFTDARLRRVLQTKQAGLLRTFVQRDSYNPERIAFDRQVLTDFYQSRGYIDFRILDVTSEFSRERNAFFVTFRVQEGQQWTIANTSVRSEYPSLDAAAYQQFLKIGQNEIYSPNAIDDVINRMERQATRDGLSFLRVEPRITRNPRDLSVNVEFVLTRGPRVFVERIDIEGNATTLDRVVRRQFKVVEGDPFNPREIREAAERVRALGFFSAADVNARQGSAPDQVVVDVNLEESTTGSFNFGLNYGATSGAAVAFNITQRNFLGRGQLLEFDAVVGNEDAEGRFLLTEPAFLGRDLSFSIGGKYTETQYTFNSYDTREMAFLLGLGFPIGETTRLGLEYRFESNELFDPDSGASALILADEARGAEYASIVGYDLSYDNRRTGLNPDAGIVLRFGQDFAGLGGDNKYIKSSALAGVETRVANDQVTLRAEVEGGYLYSLDGDSRAYDRFWAGPRVIRGFAPGGIGPRDSGDFLGGNRYVAARLEAEFPLGLPEEYGLSGGVFLDAGSLWDLDNNLGGSIDDSLIWRSSAGASLFWTTPLGPLRFNFSRAINKESYDDEQRFDLTISTRF
ncbi:outer membrane protein assembly factor BamA [Aliiroseovarius sp. PTFE2010]|uniref:outer membrane protein assembly factor BamA n=1 Tax=Aliiroseovarius sp. PTFE2010 TaxID=3417190 RepID=UPI003CFA917D